MINHSDNPDYLNSFLDYTITILNKSPNTIKEYNYDLAMFLKFIKIRFNMTNEDDFSKIVIKDISLDTIKKIKLDDIHAFLSYLTTTYHSKATTRARKASSIRVFFNYLCAKANLITVNPAQNLETPKLDRRLPKYYNRRKIMDNMNENINNEEVEKEYEEFVEHHTKGHFAQSLKWAKTKTEWQYEIVVVRNSTGKIKGAMLLLIRKMPIFNTSLIYSPRGPVFDIYDEETFRELTKKAEEVCKKYNAFMLKMDPDISNLDMKFKQIAQNNGYQIVEKVKNLNDIAHPRIVFRLNLANKTEDELFASFHQKTRYNIRLATKKQVTVREGSRKDIAEFQKIMEVTGTRDEFPIPGVEYFEELYDTMGEEHVKILFADYEGQPIATTFNFIYGNKVWYMFGGSLNEKRNLMPTYLLQWEGIKWAKQKGCDIYDFRGICATDLEHRNEGLYRFKKGFEPDLIEFTEIYKVYNPFMYFVFKKLFPLYRKFRVMLMKKNKNN